jgi:hypothetical protein
LFLLINNSSNEAEEHQNERQSACQVRNNDILSKTEPDADATGGRAGFLASQHPAAKSANLAEL